MIFGRRRADKLTYWQKWTGKPGPLHRTVVEISLKISGSKEQIRKMEEVLEAWVGIKNAAGDLFALLSEKNEQDDEEGRS